MWGLWIFLPRRRVGRLLVIEFLGCVVGGIVVGSEPGRMIGCGVLDRRFVDVKFSVIVTSGTAGGVNIISLLRQVCCFLCIVHFCPDRGEA